MTHRYLEEYVATGEVVTPYELFANYAPLVAEHNGHLDRSNFGLKGLTHDDFKSKAFVALHEAHSEPAQALVAQDILGTDWVDVSGSDMTLVVGESLLIIEAAVCYFRSAASDDHHRVATGVRVGGEVFACGNEICGNNSTHNYGSVSVVYKAPAGSYRIVPVIRIYRGDETTVPTAPLSLEITLGHVMVTERRR